MYESPRMAAALLDDIRRGQMNTSSHGSVGVAEGSVLREDGPPQLSVMQVLEGGHVTCQRMFVEILPGGCWGDFAHDIQHLLCKDDTTGATPLHVAAYHPSCWRRLFYAYRNSNLLGDALLEKEKNGMTPLHWAVSVGAVELSALLVREGTAALGSSAAGDIRTAKDKYGRTPLHCHNGIFPSRTQQRPTVKRPVIAPDGCALSVRVFVDLVATLRAVKLIKQPDNAGLTSTDTMMRLIQREVRVSRAIQSYADLLATIATMKHEWRLMGRALFRAARWRENPYSILMTHDPLTDADTEYMKVCKGPPPVRLPPPRDTSAATPPRRGAQVEVNTTAGRQQGPDGREGKGGAAGEDETEDHNTTVSEYGNSSEESEVEEERDEGDYLKEESKSEEEPPQPKGDVAESESESETPSDEESGEESSQHENIRHWPDADSPDSGESETETSGSEEEYSFSQLGASAIVNGSPKTNTTRGDAVNSTHIDYVSGGFGKEDLEADATLKQTSSGQDTGMPIDDTDVLTPRGGGCSLEHASGPLPCAGKCVLDAFEADNGHCECIQQGEQPVWRETTSLLCHPCVQLYESITTNNRANVEALLKNSSIFANAHDCADPLRGESPLRWAVVTGASSDIMRALAAKWPSHLKMQLRTHTPRHDASASAGSWTRGRLHSHFYGDTPLHIAVYMRKAL
ncbi:unnamed protein product [Vitrella brassicaformis CCMP3155]|uniref:Uncharacterized protein n=1 Tax=Vitrella brassicaformis (strain CCMP3155) TaxID=1169540 RepID=A0A0G4EET7_VITBC|nr:unnamed protein product [Vitrella brassicaformis CCMP3155]|eukprot:CEL94521.1 unnamed protein product [Vitrella brassicaformis CCMP3155]